MKQQLEDEKDKIAEALKPVVEGMGFNERHNCANCFVAVIV